VTVTTTPLYPINLVLQGRPVLLVGGDTVALHKAEALAQAGARLRVVAPSIAIELVELAERVAARPFVASDLDEVQLVVAAASHEINRAVTQAAHARGLFVLAVDQPADGSAQSPAVLRRAGLTVAISTNGAAPALAGLLREALEALLPDDAEASRWLDVARRARSAWRRDGRAHATTRPLLLTALTSLYEGR